MIRFLFRAFWMLVALLSVLIFIGWEKDISKEEARTLFTNKDSRFMEVMGVQVHYRDEGNPADSVPLVLIHGTSSSLHTWDSLTVLLKSEKRIIRFDLPAFGLTGINPENRYGIDYYATFTKNFLDALGVRQCLISGNSLGGGIAWNFAVKYPEFTRGLILFDATGYPRKGESGALGFKVASLPVVNRLLLVVTPRSLVKKSLQQSYGNPELVTEQLVDRYHKLILMEGNRKAALSLFSNPSRLDTSLIRTIKAPTLIVWGMEDRLIRYENAEKFGRDIAGSESLILEGVGHVPMEEHPVWVASIMRDFIFQKKQ